MQQIWMAILNWINDRLSDHENRNFRRDVRSEPTRGGILSPEDQNFYRGIQQLTRTTPVFTKPIEQLEPKSPSEQSIVMPGSVDELRSRIAARRN